MRSLTHSNPFSSSSSSNISPLAAAAAATTTSNPSAAAVAERGALYRDEDEADIQEQAALLVNDAPEAQEPVDADVGRELVSRELEADEDLERGTR